MITSGQRGATRLQPDGNVDNTFTGVGGVPTFDVVYAMAHLANGQYLVSRSDVGRSRRDIFFRVNSGGSSDDSFKPDVTSVRSIALDRDAILVTGTTSTAAEAARGDNRYAVGRFNRDGTRDATFRRAELNTGASLLPAVLDADGNIIIAGNFTQVNARSGRALRDS